MEIILRKILQDLTAGVIKCAKFICALYFIQVNLSFPIVKIPYLC